MEDSNEQRNSPQLFDEMHRQCQLSLLMQIDQISSSLLSYQDLTTLEKVIANQEFDCQNMKKSIKSSSSNYSHSLSRNAKIDFEEIIEQQQIIKKVEKSRNSKRKSDYYEISFPLTNTYSQQHLEQFAYTTLPIDQRRYNHTNQAFIKADVRYFNWELFIQEMGKFQVLIVDPPWRIKGAQKNDSQHMFSNCKFSLEYNTMSFHEIRQVPVHLLTDQGFIFLWILNTQFNSSLQIMQSWGYELIQELVWVKLKNEKVCLSHGYYFLHSYEICLVGYKNKKKDKESMSLRTGINPNVIFGQVRKKSQKPEDLYTLIEMMFKGKKKLELFSRNHNIRFGIFSIGNQLGESYDKWFLVLNCDRCERAINTGNKRFKSKERPNYDICQKCIRKSQKNKFFEIANEVDEDVRHEYLSCNYCQVQPIWGVRFQCLTCSDYDLCEICYDKYLSNANVNGQIHPLTHQFRTLEVPVFGYGFQIHPNKCSSCYQNPIIGVCISCLTCKNFKLCKDEGYKGQKCFFQRPRFSQGGWGYHHRPHHQFEAIYEQIWKQKKIECFNCKKTIGQNCWKCENCYSFYFCDDCYSKRDGFKSLYANNHKKYHVFRKVF